MKNNATFESFKIMNGDVVCVEVAYNEFIEAFTFITTVQVSKEKIAKDDNQSITQIKR